MGNGSVAVFWLRGGGQYRLYADWDADWTVKTSTYTNSEQILKAALASIQSQSMYRAM